MATQAKKGDKTVEAFVKPAPGGMFKGYLRITTVREGVSRVQEAGREAGRAVKEQAEALALAQAAAQRELAR